jgi:hypothetical protein
LPFKHPLYAPSSGAYIPFFHHRPATQIPSADLAGIAGLKFLITLFIRGLPRSSTEESVTALFSKHGKVRSLKLVTDIFSGECKGFATIDMEGHEGRAAMSALDGKTVDGSVIRVGPNRPKNRRGGRSR